MKRSTCLFVVLFSLVFTTSVALAEKKPIKLKAVQFINLKNPSEKPFHFFVDLVNKEAKGELEIEIVGGPEAIPGREQPEARAPVRTSSPLHPGMRMSVMTMSTGPCTVSSNIDMEMYWSRAWPSASWTGSTARI